VAPSIAEQLAKRQKKISVSEFFERNKHILGFDSMTKSLITSVKEGLDNALDVCEEARVLPDILVEMERIDQREYKIVVEDNGPGIVAREVPKIFGQLLYGSRFHRMVQSRGQQGMGISAVVMYGQITTGHPAVITTKTAGSDTALRLTLTIDTKRNRPNVIQRERLVWEREHGTRVEVRVRGRYVGGRLSILEYLRATAIVNPHARIEFRSKEAGSIVFERVTDELPPEPVEIKPHPKGIELGTLMEMAKATKAYKMTSFLKTEFSRVSHRVAQDICRRADVPEDLRPKQLKLEQGRDLLAAIKKVKIMAPPTDCLSPIGERLIRKGLRNVLGGLKPDYYCPPITREARVYAGHPFQAEVGIVYGGQLDRESPVDILRFANRVPLLYQQGACAITKAIESVDWRRYGLEQRGGKGLPHGPAVIMVHIASTQVPFTSEAKEAVAHIPVIEEEIALALKACGRKLKTHLGKKARRAKAREKFDIVQRILPMIAEKSAKVTGRKVPSLHATMTKIMNVVWVDEKVAYEKGGARVTVNLWNYTSAGKKFRLHAHLPENGFDPAAADPTPEEFNGGKVTWNLKRIPPTEKAEVTFFMAGVREGELGETDLYVSGINPVMVIGAEPLPGDWDLDVEPMEEEAEPEEEEDEEEAEDLEELEDEMEEMKKELHEIREELAEAGLDEVTVDEGEEVMEDA
jgi:DNA topoisomerase-6 subunit B